VNILSEMCLWTSIHSVLEATRIRTPDKEWTRSLLPCRGPRCPSGLVLLLIWHVI